MSELPPTADNDRDQLFYHWSGSLQKFDHFVAGLLAAWLAFLLRDYHPMRLAFCPPNTSTLDLAALVAVLSALIFGVIKIARNIEIDRISYEILPRVTRLARLLEHQANEFKDQADMLENFRVTVQGQKRQKTMFLRSKRLGECRNWAGLLGVVLLIVSRIAAAY